MAFSFDIKRNRDTGSIINSLRHMNNINQLSVSKPRSMNLFVQTPFRSISREKQFKGIDRIDDNIIMDVIPKLNDNISQDIPFDNVNVLKSKPYVMQHGQDINVVDGSHIYPLLRGVQSIDKSEQADDGSGIFLSFQFDLPSAQHDISLGHLPHGKLMTLSRIKRWWQGKHQLSFLHA